LPQNDGEEISAAQSFSRVFGMECKAEHDMSEEAKRGPERVR